MLRVEGMPADMNSFWQALRKPSRRSKQKHCRPIALLFGLGVSVADNNTRRVAFVWCATFLYFIIIIIMAEEGGNNNDNVFIYMGGDQEVPRDVTHAVVDRSVDTISAWAFGNRRQLASIEMHDGVKLIEDGAFEFCSSLKGIKLPGVRVIEQCAFFHCEALEEVEFGNQLETIGYEAFYCCTSLRIVKLPKVRAIEDNAFVNCEQLTEAELPKDLERIGHGAFQCCPRLRRIVMPLKNDILNPLNHGDFNIFCECDKLSHVDLVGGIHKTISSLPLDRWRNEMNEEIGRINQVLPKTHVNCKTKKIHQWTGRVLQRIQHYKSEHYALLKGNMTQLELALWKSKLQGEEFSLSSDLCASLEKKMTFLELARWKAKVDEEFAGAKRARLEARVNCGANIIIPHVLSFLNDEDVFPTLNHNS